MAELSSTVGMPNMALSLRLMPPLLMGELFIEFLPLPNINFWFVFFWVEVIGLSPLALLCTSSGIEISFLVEISLTLEKELLI